MAIFVLLAGAGASARAAETGFQLGQGTTPRSVALGSDGSVWFAGAHYRGYGAGTSAVVGHVTPGGEVQEYEVPPLVPETGTSANDLSAASAITQGPDGALWFTADEQGAGRIGRITTAGAISEYALPSPDSPASAITTGPDGNLWFAEPQANAIGRITPAGAISEFPLPSGSNPLDIATGSDGALWFTEPVADKIGRITPAGAISEFPASTSATSTPNQITLGPDGNLWFTEGVAPKAKGYKASLANEVSRVTPTGTVTMFRVAARSGGTGDIVAGPRGRLWFETGGEIAWIATSGQTAPGSCQCGGPVQSLAVGAEGALWFGASYRPYLGGGGGGILSLGDPGFVGPYSPPPLTIGLSVPPLRHRLTSIRVNCDSADACEGTLEMRSALGPKASLVGHGLYSLAAGEGGRFPLRLNRKGQRLLRHYGGRLRVSVYARDDGRLEASRLVVVRGAKPKRGR